MPAAIPSMWRALKRGYQAEPRLMTVAVSFALFSALPDALIALWLKLLADGTLGKNRRLVLGAALGLGASAAGTWLLKVVSDRTLRRFRDRVTIALESHIARLLASVATITHHERPDYLDRLSVLRNQVFVLDHMYMSLFTTAGWILRLGVTMALLDVDSSCARSAGGVGLADSGLIGVAARGRAGSGRARRRGESPGAASVRYGDHGAARQGSARYTNRRSFAERAARGVGALVRPRRQGPLGQRDLAHAGAGRSSRWAMSAP